MVMNYSDLALYYFYLSTWFGALANLLPFKLVFAGISNLVIDAWYLQDVATAEGSGRAGRVKSPTTILLGLIF